MAEDDGPYESKSLSVVVCDPHETGWFLARRVIDAGELYEWME